MGRRERVVPAEQGPGKLQTVVFPACGHDSVLGTLGREDADRIRFWRRAHVDRSQIELDSLCLGRVVLIKKPPAICSLYAGRPRREPQRSGRLPIAHSPDWTRARALKHLKRCAARCEKPAPGYDTLPARLFEFIPFLGICGFSDLRATARAAPQLWHRGREASLVRRQAALHPGAPAVSAALGAQAFLDGSGCDLPQQLGPGA